jgi:selenobiotic family peptide radical SAM maturase
MPDELKTIFPITGSYCPETFKGESDAELFLEKVRKLSNSSQHPAYLFDLARTEFSLYQLYNQEWQEHVNNRGGEMQVNPTLQLLEVGWRPILQLLDGAPVTPEHSPQILMLWRKPTSGEICRGEANASDLLALKTVTEELDPLEIAGANGQPVGIIDAAIEKAVQKGLLLAPPSKLRRNGSDFPLSEAMPSQFLTAEMFTLQWHITHRCDLHCRHCYDRSDREDVALAQGIGVLDQLRQFCRERHVGGQVSFSGGNPFLHPDFLTLYHAAHARNLSLAILGNPVSKEQLEGMLQIAKPSFYQVSLEGLQEHNDFIRGEGNYDSVLAFLDLLKEKRIYSMVMLTITKANMAQVLPLAEVLRDRVDLFTFNRLAMVGEGANLESPGPLEYQAFIESFLKACEQNPAIALKDSLINIQLDQNKHSLFGGCTGYGCGAAFNFVSLLPDGQVHACRKFPSQIGDLSIQTLEDIYSSTAAQDYRRGCSECADCRLRAVCGGCLAVTYGWGLDPLKNKDPGCFMS